MNRLFRKAISILFILGFIGVFSCKKNTNNPAEQSHPSLKADNPNPFPFESELLMGSNFNFTKGTYTGTIGGKNITLIVSGTNLAFQVPEIIAGNYDMKANIEGTDYTISFAVKDLPKVTDPRQYLTDFFNTNNDLKIQMDSIKQQLAPFMDTALFSKDLFTANTILNNEMDSLAKLNSNEQMKAAQVIAANRIWMDAFHSDMQVLLNDVANIGIHKRTEYPDDQERQAIQDAITKGKTLREYVIPKMIVLGTAGALAGAPVFGITAGAGAIVGAAVGFGWGVAEWAVDNAVFNKIERFMIQPTDENLKQKRQTIYSFTNNQATAFNVAINFRSFTKDDVNSAFALTQGFISLVSSIDDADDNFNSLFPKYALKSEPQRISNISTPNTTVRNVNTQFVTVSNISNSNVTFQGLSDQGGKVAFTFKTSQNTDQNFTFDLVYENPGISKMTTTMHGILSASARTVTDIDGNIYHTVNIGTQVWMVENLKTTHYRDGSAIPNITADTTWIHLTTGAYCDFGNYAYYSTTYGRLYNGYAISNSHNICPTGWHVPSDAEWTTLTTFLGGESIAGRKLKETGTTHWQSPNTGATNETGFTALPSGFRNYDGLFSPGYYGSGSIGYWWSSGVLQLTSGRGVMYNNIEVTRIGESPTVGYSVRCVKD
jgi:uncharacterized protein (TIGR02145 family)